MGVDGGVAGDFLVSPLGGDSIVCGVVLVIGYSSLICLFVGVLLDVDGDDRIGVDALLLFVNNLDDDI